MVFIAPGGALIDPPLSYSHLLLILKNYETNYLHVVENYIKYVVPLIL